MKLFITGIRGVPAAHGGFETFAENLALFFVDLGWQVIVYCQETTDLNSEIYESDWKGVRRIHIPVKGDGAKATVIFDYLSIKHASKNASLVLTLGYNTALFNFLLRVNGINNLINMDGIEWRREKWRWYEKWWLYLNERAGCLIGNHLIADNPEIKSHLATHVCEDKITMIPYGAREVNVADVDLIQEYNLKAGDYAILIARPEPENSILEIVRAFSVKARGKKLVVLGKYDQKNLYHKQVMLAASEEVVFIGAVYDHRYLDSLRFNACLYIHGHTVGGTNPSLIEALGAGQPVVAHDNKFNRWVVGSAGKYFSNIEELDVILTSLLRDELKLKNMSDSSRRRFNEDFTWKKVLSMYEELLKRYIKN